MSHRELLDECHDFSPFTLEEAARTFPTFRPFTDGVRAPTSDEHQHGGAGVLTYISAWKAPRHSMVSASLDPRGSLRIVWLLAPTAEEVERWAAMLWPSCLARAGELLERPAVGAILRGW